MRQPEKETLIKSVGAFVAERIAAAFVPVTERIKSLEQRAPVPGPKGDPGDRGEKGDAGAAADTAEIIEHAKRVSADAVSSVLERIATIEQRAPERGEKGDTGERGEAGTEGPTGPMGPEGPPGPRGEKGESGPAGIAGDRGQEGPEGKPGRDGRDGLPGVQGEKGIDGLNGKDGRDGIDGKDGLGVSDLDVAYDGERTFTFRWSNGERKEERAFVVPMVIDRGVFKAETQYRKGDAVTFGGSIFIAQRDTDARPETSDDWRLGVKRGRDGKDGRLVPEKPREPVRMS